MIVKGANGFSRDVGGPPSQMETVVWDGKEVPGNNLEMFIINESEKLFYYYRCLHEWNRGLDDLTKIYRATPDEFC